MNIPQRVGREIKRVLRVTRRVLGVTAGLESDDSDDEMGKNYADGAQTVCSVRRPRSESWSTAPSPGPLTRQTSLPDLREISTRPQVDVEKIREPFGEVRVRPASTPEPRRAREPISVGPPENLRTTSATRDINSNHTEGKTNLVVRTADIKPTYRLIEPPPRVSVIYCQNNISNVMRRGKSLDYPKLV